MYKFGLVVLHYNTIEKTISCISSLLSQEVNDEISFKICLVCNGSTDGSDSQLESIYEENDKIYVVKIEKNIPFSNAMNYGVKKIDSNKYDFICLINNDTVIEGSNLFLGIIDAYKKYNFDFMGPAIYSVSTKSYDNPIYKKLDYKKWRIRLSIIKSDYNLLLKKWKKTSLNSYAHESNFIDKPIEDCVLHGAFLIFSKKYIEFYPGVIYPQNSFYMEEDILYYLCKIKGLKTLYYPGIMVNHIHSVSILKSFNNNIIKKQKFVMEEHKKSKKVLLKIIKNKDTFTF